jgi:hypothetical protein
MEDKTRTEVRERIKTLGMHTAKKGVYMTKKEMLYFHNIYKLALQGTLPAPDFWPIAGCIALKTIAKANSISVTGTRAVLIQRIQSKLSFSLRNS